LKSTALDFNIREGGFRIFIGFRGFRGFRGLGVTISQMCLSLAIEIASLIQNARNSSIPRLGYWKCQ